MGGSIMAYRSFAELVSNVLAMQRYESWSYKISEAHKLSYILKTFSAEIGKVFGNRNCNLHRIVSQLLIQIV